METLPPALTTAGLGASIGSLLFVEVELMETPDIVIEHFLYIWSLLFVEVELMETGVIRFATVDETDMSRFYS